MGTDKMILRVQQFEKGHLLYSDKWIENTNPKIGVVGKFQSVFGQLVDGDGNFICYTMERKDTLISLGRRRFRYYDSPANKMKVLLFEDEPGSGTYERKFEMHIANYAYELKGCTSVGMGINLDKPSITLSRIAFDKVMKHLDGYEGFIYHEKLKTK